MTSSTLTPRPGRIASPGALPLLLFLTVSLVAPVLLDAQMPSAASHNPMAGSRVYGEAGCARCHAVRGHGAGDAVDLATITGARSFYALAAALWNHLPRHLEAMQEKEAASTRLDADEAGNLVAFLFVLGYFDPAGEPDRGRRLFREKSCIECHQVGGAGGVVGPDLDYLRLLASPIQVATAMWNHGPRMLEELRQREIPRPSFTAAEFVDLIAFLEASSPGIPERSLYVLPGSAGPGRDLYRAKNCVRCHGTPGSGGRIGPDLGRRAGGRSLLRFAAAMWNHQPRMLDEARARGIEIPPLRADEMADLVAYLYSVRYLPGEGRRGRGGSLVRTKGCLDCHATGKLEGSATDRGRRGGGGESAAAVMARMWNHVALATREGMEGGRFEALSEEEMADVAAYLLGTSAGGR